MQHSWHPVSFQKEQISGSRKTCYSFKIRRKLRLHYFSKVKCRKAFQIYKLPGSVQPSCVLAVTSVLAATSSTSSTVQPAQWVDIVPNLYTFGSKYEDTNLSSDLLKNYFLQHISGYVKRNICTLLLQPSFNQL